jgi:hypothetical protein
MESSDACEFDWSKVEETCSLTYFLEFIENKKYGVRGTTHYKDTALMRYLKYSDNQDIDLIQKLLTYHPSMAYTNKLG